MDVTSSLGSAIKGYNAELINRVSTFKASNSGVTTWIYDSNTRLGQILDSPATYGFQDATSYGAGSTSPGATTSTYPLEFTITSPRILLVSLLEVASKLSKELSDVNGHGQNRNDICSPIHPQGGVFLGCL
ncbi:carbohydrate esterase family 16 protein [Tulasnella calospora MUT 4182]|uniref:Carbohydrate esterase family 16 protein n=1 Tax=Tulasnella calospora MUT 4182 TaxID=1051891 RepID=A0A0C3QTE3_9AGAM|nr:carbohydrate esterase family 16 protein [Tulasnella calospora MUT 4182]